MLTSLDHIVIAVRDLPAATDLYGRLLGRRPSWRGVHPGYGTANTLLRLDNTYLELLSPSGAASSTVMPLTRKKSSRIPQSGNFLSSARRRPSFAP